MVNHQDMKELLEYTTVDLGFYEEFFYLYNNNIIGRIDGSHFPTIHEDKYIIDNDTIIFVFNRRVTFQGEKYMIGSISFKCDQKQMAKFKMLYIK